MNTIRKFALATGVATVALAVPASIAAACETPAPPPCHSQQHGYGNDNHGHDDGDQGNDDDTPPQPVINVTYVAPVIPNPTVPILVDTTVPPPPVVVPAPIIVNPPPTTIVVAEPGVDQTVADAEAAAILKLSQEQTPAPTPPAPAPTVALTAPAPAPTGKVLTIHPNDTWKHNRIVRFSVQIAGPGAAGAHLQFAELQQKGNKWVRIGTGTEPAGHVFNVAAHHAYTVWAVNGGAYSVHFTVQ